MKYNLLFIFLIIALYSFGQVPLTFSEKGTLENLPPVKIGTGNTFRVTLPTALNDTVKAKIKSKLTDKIDAAIDNLTNEASALKQFYLALWGKAIYDKILFELRELKTFLTDPAFNILSRSSAFIYLPSPKEITDSLFNNPNTFAPHYSNDGIEKIHQVKVIFRDPVKNFLINDFTKSMVASDWKNIRNNYEYENDWSFLKSSEKSVTNMLAYLNGLDPMPMECNPIDDTSGIIAFHKAIMDNRLIRLFRTDTMYKRWIWFTNGDFKVNPLSITSNERKIIDPTLAKEKADLFENTLQRKIDSMVTCCDTDAEKIEALIKQKGTGKKRFKTAESEGEETIGIISLEYLENANRVANEVYLPASTSENRKWLKHYNAQKKYSNNEAELRKQLSSSQGLKAIPEGESITLLVHNVPDNTNIAASSTKDETPDKSDGQLETDKLLGSIGDLISSVAPVSSIATNAIKLLNPRPVPIAPFQFSNPTQLQTESLPVTRPALFVAPINENDTLRVIPRTSKRDVFKRFLAKNRGAVPASFNDFDLFSNYYVSNCITGTLNYSNQEAFLTDFQLMITQFNLYLRNNIARKNTLSRLKFELANDTIILDQLIQIKNRSLPPLSFDIKTNNTALYRSVVSEIDLSEPPKKITTTITEVTARSAGSTDSTRKVGATDKFKIGKKHLFQVSAGIGFTFTDFTRKEAALNNGQLAVATDNDRVRVVAGLHIYPWKIFMMDNSFLGLKYKRHLNRLYIYTGLGLPDPLKNYYLGVGADLVPGFRLTIGTHFYRDERYKLSNNQIVENNSGLQVAGPFASFSIDPVSFAKLLGFFK